jgi:hypothetical protein
MQALIAFVTEHDALFSFSEYVTRKPPSFISFMFPLADVLITLFHFFYDSGSWSRECHVQLLPIIPVIVNFGRQTSIIIQLKETICWELVPFEIPLVVLRTISLIYFHSWCMLRVSV